MVDLCHSPCTMHDLHMTNVNTTEDKRITPPPSVIVILALYRCVMRESACERHVCGSVVRGHLHVTFF